MFRHMHATYHQGFGKIRRLFQTKFAKTFIARQVAHRKGECIRCGTCCKLLFNCPFLEEKPDGSTNCRIHQKRPQNCRIFPVSPKDLRDRDTKNPKVKCGYHFD